MKFHFSRFQIVKSALTEESPLFSYLWILLNNAQLCICVSCQGAPGATGFVGAQGVNGSEVSD